MNENKKVPASAPGLGQIQTKNNRVCRVTGSCSWNVKKKVAQLSSLFAQNVAAAVLLYFLAFSKCPQQNLTTVWATFVSKFVTQ